MKTLLYAILNIILVYQLFYIFFDRYLPKTVTIGEFNKQNTYKKYNKHVAFWILFFRGKSEELQWLINNWNATDITISL